MKYTFFILFTLFFSFSIFAQDENIRYQDWIYNPNIKSVKLHINGYPISYPILYLGSPGQLRLSFDELRADAKSYLYTIEHCTKDWETSNLPESEYIDGFGEEEIDEVDYSFNTTTLYTHYNLAFPNRDFRILLSGNYLLKIYEDEDEKKLALTRRFIVIDPATEVTGRMMRPAMVHKNRTHQELEFFVNHEDVEIRNPLSDMTATVLQNGNWQTAIKNVRPKFNRGEVQGFDYRNKFVFLGGKEHRYADIRGFEIRTSSIHTIEKDKDKVDVYLFTEEKRNGETYFDWIDSNGHFIIENRDGRVINLNQRQDSTVINEVGERAEVRVRGGSFFNAQWQRDSDLESDYANVFFTLKSSTEYYDSDIYIYGGISDWQFKEEFKMVFNPAVNAYVAKIELKQGYYDYMYAEKPKGKNIPDFETTEGSWHETENEYLILIYHSPFGSRYDRLIGAKTLNSRR
ncbi:MAG: hypothetical protein ACI9XO_002845 [Paraglaciecola sp.]|jgi:hypothetical protein